jgi:hypothetical protein
MVLIPVNGGLVKFTNARSDGGSGGGGGAVAGSGGDARRW